MIKLFCIISFQTVIIIYNCCHVVKSNEIVYERDNNYFTS